MSIVINTIYGNRAILMADTRRSREADGQVQILDEHTQKIFRLENNLAIGFTGNASLTNMILDEYWKNFTKVQYADELAPVLQEKALKMVKENGADVQFVLSGKCSDGLTGSLGILAKTGYKLESIRTKELRDIRFAILNNHADSLTESLSVLLNSFPVLDEATIRKCMEQTVIIASKLDKTVNTNVQTIELLC